MRLQFHELRLLLCNQFYDFPHGERFFSALFWQLVPIFGELSPFNFLLSNKGNILLHVAAYLSSCDCLLKTVILVLYVTLHSAVNTDHAHAPCYLMWFLGQFDSLIEFQSNFNLQLSLAYLFSFSLMLQKWAEPGNVCFEYVLNKSEKPGIMVWP